MCVFIIIIIFINCVQEDHIIIIIFLQLISFVMVLEIISNFL